MIVQYVSDEEFYKILERDLREHADLWKALADTSKLGRESEQEACQQPL